MLPHWGGEGEKGACKGAASLLEQRGAHGGMDGDLLNLLIHCTEHIGGWVNILQGGTLGTKTRTGRYIITSNTLTREATHITSSLTDLGLLKRGLQQRERLA